MLDPNLFTAETFSQAGLEAVDAPTSLADVVRRNVAGEAVDPPVSVGLQH
ncbi:hypothetical protein C6A87_014440 [Mycobacterium sp. ITM-2016-00317]|nr:hypothetical protein [Mycobacterium sp. ITM-2016-00317]WNG85177.1 hypothetical protein C6A87_014440 [Mycobacterium sp. ITM-2016-00317]